MKTILFVATVSDFMHFEINDMKILQDRGYQVEVACNIDDYNGFLEPLGVVIHDIPFARSPFSGTNVKAYKLLKELPFLSAKGPPAARPFRSESS